MKSSKKEKRPKTAVIYTRVSTEEQAETGYSLAHQEEVLRRECTRLGIEVVEHFQDDGYSAKTFKRPAFSKLLDYIEKHSVDFFYVMKWDRFSRNIENSYEMLSRFKKLGVEARCLEESLDPNDPVSVLLRALKLAEPDMENRRRSLNTRMGMARAKQEGRYVGGTPPLGYIWARDNKQKPIIIHGIDAPLVQEAFALYASGLFSINGVRKLLLDKGLKISKSQFYALLRNPVYAGLIFVKGGEDEEDELIQGIHQPIVSNELFERVQKLLGKMQQKQKGCKISESIDMPLRGFLQCSKCCQTLTGSGSSGNGGKYFYYHCQNGCKTRFRADSANLAFVHYLGSFKVNPEVGNLYMAVVDDTFKVQEGDREKEIVKLRKEQEELESKLLKIEERYIDDALDRDSYVRLKASVDQKREVCQERIEQLQAMDTSFMKYCRFGMTLLSDLDFYYEEASLEVKRKLIGSIFTEKLVFENGSYRTTKVNEAVELIGQFQRELGNKKDGRFSFEGKTSDHVPMIGLEPTLGCPK